MRLYRMVEFIGRWSMVDVFVDTFTAALVQLPPLMSVAPAPGLFFFAAVVVLTMLAVESFDPRLIWDSLSSVGILGHRAAEQPPDRGAAPIDAPDAGRRSQERFDMPDSEKPLPHVPESRAVAKKRTRLSAVWIIPIVAAVAGAWVAVTRIMGEGPKITIVFKSAEGLEAGKTKIHYNGVDVGTLTTIRLSDDHQHVITTAQMAPKTESLLVDDTHFWVVRPRISGANVSGLGTLISGAYVGMEIGESQKAKREFVALETPPVVTGDVPGRFFVLEDARPGLARRRHADLLPPPAGRSGRVVRARQGRRRPERQGVRQGALRPVRQPEHALLARERDRRVALGERPQRADPVAAVHPRSAASPSRRPPRIRPLPPAEADTAFTLFSDRAEAFKPPARDPQTYVLVFKQSVRGLAPGAPVEFRGIPIGEVTEVGRTGRRQDLRVLRAGDHPPGRAEARGQGRRAGPGDGSRGRAPEVDRQLGGARRARAAADREPAHRGPVRRRSTSFPTRRRRRWTGRRRRRSCRPLRASSRRSRRAPPASSRRSTRCRSRRSVTICRAS